MAPHTLGAHSPRLDAVRALRTKKGRREQRRYFVEGRTMLGEALAAGARPVELYATEAGLETLGTFYDTSVAATIVTDRTMAKLSDLETPPGVVAVFDMPDQDVGSALEDGSPAVVLAGIGDPGNAGTLLRTAEIFGIRSAVFTPDAVEPFNPKVIRATMGATFRMRLAVAPAADILAAARRYRYTPVAAARGGEELPGFTFPERPLIAIGNERHGIAASLPGIERTVAIPQCGAGESLNAAVAGGIIFYAFSQQCESSIRIGQTSKKP